MRVGVVGGGLLGMTVAWEAAKRGDLVTIFEGAPRCGGLASPWRLGNVVWDRHYHVTLLSDLALRGLLDELGLSDEMNWVTTSTGFYVDGRLVPFTTVVDFLRFPPLSLIQKLRLGATITHASRIRDWRPLERLTAVDWLTQQCGARTVEKIWMPLLRAKLGDSAMRASAAFIWAIIARMYAARRTGMKREMFGYPSGGYDTVLRAFERKLTEQGVEIQCNRRVDSITSEGGEVVVRAAAVETPFDQVLVTLASPLAAQLCPGLRADELQLASRIRYQGIVCVSLLLDRPLTPYYITNIADASVPFTAVIEMTALVDRNVEFGGRSLVYLPKYVCPEDPLFEQTDAEIREAFVAALERMHPSFSRNSVLAFRVSRVPYVFPIPTLGYSEHLPPIETSVPGLFVANSAHIVNGTLNVNETVKLARQVTEIMRDAARPQLEAAV